MIAIRGSDFRRDMTVVKPVLTGELRQVSSVMPLVLRVECAALIRRERSGVFIR